MNVLRHWFRSLSSARRRPVPRPHRPRSERPRPLHVESLEDRTVPSIMFSNTGSRSIVDTGGPILQSMQVDLIFWGAHWTDAGGNQMLRTNVHNTVNAILNSPYFDGLAQYRGIGHGTLLREDLITAPSPGSTFQTGPAGDLATMVANNINNGTLPSPNGRILYFVVPQPGSTASDCNGCSGRHLAGTASGNRIFPYGVTNNPFNVSLDTLGPIISHEMAEAASNPEWNVPNQAAFHVPGSNGDEIGDGEAQNYTYRVHDAFAPQNTALVQAFLSQRDHSYIVTNGSTNNFLVSSAFVLTFQVSPFGQNSIFLNRVGNGVYAELNSSTAQFEPGAISAIQLNSGNGNGNTIDISGTPVPLTATSTGTASVLVGAHGSLGNILASVTVGGGPNKIDLYVDDSADTFADRQVTLTDTSLTISPSTVINYSPSAIRSLILEGGPGSSGTNTYHVLNTPAGQTTIRMRGGHDFMQVHGDQGPLAAGGFANNSILVGDAGSLGGIRAAVSVANIGGLAAATLTVDDSADTFADRLITLTGTALTVEQPGLVTVNYSAITSLTYEGGPGSSGANTYHVRNTPTGQTTIRTRGGNDFVQVHGDQGPVAVGGFANNSILVGNAGSLGAIQAAVSVANIGGLTAATLTVDDSADTFADRQVTLSDTLLTISPSTVINYSAITALTYEGGPGSSGANTYQLLNTIAGQTTVRTRGSHDFVQVHADQGPLAVGGFANNSIVVGDAGSLGGIQAAVSVANIGGLTAATLTVDDSADTFADRLVTLTGSALTVEQPGLVTVNYSAITSLTYEGGPGSSGANTYHVLSTPTGQTTIRARGGNDTLVGPDAGTTVWHLVDGIQDGLFGDGNPVAIFGGFTNLVGGSGNNTFQFSDGYQLPGSIDGGGGGNTVDYSAYASSNVVVDLALQTPFATGVGGSVARIQNVIGASGGGAQGLYNLLIGNGGNTLTGGSGRRNILVAGASASILNAGDSEDLLIGGYTSYDNDPNDPGLANWQQIAAYWAGTDDYFTRVATLTTPDSGVPLLDATTVTGNGGGNVMNGNGALALIYSDGNDTISGFDPNSRPPITIIP